MVPNIHGLDRYEGNLIHSHNYRLKTLKVLECVGFKHRKPEQFESQRVLILGGGASGTDIAVEVAGKASKVFSCYALTLHTCSNI